MVSAVGVTKVFGEGLVDSIGDAAIAGSSCMIVKVHHGCKFSLRSFKSNQRDIAEQTHLAYNN